MDCYVPLKSYYVFLGSCSPRHSPRHQTVEEYCDHELIQDIHIVVEETITISPGNVQTFANIRKLRWLLKSPCYHI